MPKKGSFKDLTLNNPYGRLTAIRIAYRQQRKVYWLVRCSCPDQTEKVVRGTHLSSGRTKSCGCLSKEMSGERAKQLNTTHGLKKHPLYKRWIGIRSRCYKSTAKGYRNYGGRGITVCDEWRYSFQAFYDWAIVGYRDGLTINRIDNDGPYAPWNCEWATQAEQNRNYSQNVVVEFDGNRMALVDAVEKSGTQISYQRVLNRYRSLGWSLEKSLFTPNQRSFYGKERKVERNDN